MTIVTAEEYPQIVKAFHVVEEDSNGPRAVCVPIYSIPEVYKDQLLGIEKALAELSRTTPPPEALEIPPHVRPDPWLDSEFFIFCCGEYSEVLAMAGRSLDLQWAHTMLNDHFDGWTETDPRHETLVNRLEFLVSRGRLAEVEIVRMELTSS